MSNHADGCTCELCRITDLEQQLAEREAGGISDLINMCVHGYSHNGRALCGKCWKAKHDDLEQQLATVASANEVLVADKLALMQQLAERDATIAEQNRLMDAAVHAFWEGSADDEGDAIEAIAAHRRQGNENE